MKSNAWLSLTWCGACRRRRRLTCASLPTSSPHPCNQFTHRCRYTAISPQCNTSFITRSSAQSAAVALEARAMGFDATAYTAYNFVKGPGCPVGLSVEEQMAAAAADALDVLVVVNQNGAQNSNSTIGVVYDDIRTYLASAKGAHWNTTIIGECCQCIRVSCFAKREMLLILSTGIDDYSQNDTFNQLLIQHTTVRVGSSGRGGGCQHARHLRR